MAFDVFELLRVIFGHDLHIKDLLSSEYAKLPHWLHEVAANTEEKFPFGQSMQI
jgi:hypothetical protein